MKRTRTWILIGLAALGILVVVALAAVPYLVDTPRIQALIASSATQALGRPLTFSEVSLSVLPLPSLILEDLEVAEDPAFDRAPFLKLKQAEVRLRLWPLLRLRVEFGDVVLKEPTVSLIRRPDGRWNITTLGQGGEPRAPGRPRPGGGGIDGGPAALTVQGSRIKVDDGVLTYESRTAGRAARYRVEDLDLTLEPGPGPLAFEGEARVTPGDLRVKISDGTVGIHEARALTEAPLGGRLRLEGQDVRELMASLMGPEPAVTGGLKGTLALGGTVGKPRASGDIELTSVTVTRTNAQCPEPKRRTLALGSVTLNATWEHPRFTARPATTSIAQGSITTNLTATLDGATRVELGDLGIRGLRVEQVLVDFLCQGYAVTGPLDLTGTAAARLDQPAATLGGRGQFRLGPGKVVGSQALALLQTVLQISGAVSALLTGEAATGLQDSAFDYDSITAAYTMTNGVVSTRDLLLVAGNLKVTAAGTYGLATGAMNLDLAIATSRRELRARVTGNAAAPQVALAPGRRLLTPREHEKLGEGLRELLEKFR